VTRGVSNSHTKRALELCTGQLHPAFSEASVQRQCLAKWIIGATDLWEDIFNQPRLYEASGMVCRLCKSETSVETKAPLLTDCVGTQDLRERLRRRIDQEARAQIQAKQPDDGIIVSLLAAFSGPFRPSGLSKQFTVHLP
jgi:hypothetical protein